MIYSTTSLEYSTIHYLPTIRPNARAFISFLLISFISILISLPFIDLDIYVKTVGVTRPIKERTEVRPTISGIIDTIFFEEGSHIEKNALLLRIKDLNTKSKRYTNHFESSERVSFISDLSILTATGDINSEVVALLQTPQYRQQALRFIHQKNDYKASLKKATHELQINTSLAKEKVISGKELFDIQINHERIQSSYKAFVEEQLSSWQQDFTKYRLELSEFRQQRDQINAEANYYELRAPVSGTIQGLNVRYSGGLIQPTEAICTISPDEELIGECYVQTKDIGLLKKEMLARFQFEAFNYNYFGTLTGKIIAIDNDFTIQNAKPVYKVRCSFDETQLHLKNGYIGLLKKGLGFQVSFPIARRSLWQLLFDKFDDWLNPNAPGKTG